MISIDDFKNCEIVIVEIKEAKEHPNADRLYLLKVDMGGEERQVVAGIRQSYALEDLVGKQVLLLRNLQPAVIRGEESNGMVLAVSDKDGITVITPDRPVELGSRVS